MDGVETLFNVSVHAKPRFCLSTNAVNYRMAIKAMDVHEQPTYDNACSGSSDVDSPNYV